MTLARMPHQFARWVLLWFALTLTAAIAAPVVSGDVVNIVCSAQGVQLADPEGDGALAAKTTASLHCPLCMPMATLVGQSATPSVSVAVNHWPLTWRWPPAHSAHDAAPPLPSRGPPVSC